MTHQLSALVARELSASSPPVLEGAMRRTSALWEVFMLRFEEALERYRKRRLTGRWNDADEMLADSIGRFPKETLKN